MDTIKHIKTQFQIHQDVCVPKPYAYCHEVEVDNTNELRLYKYDQTDFVIQIRTHAPTNKNQDGKPRNMIAGCHINIAELQALVDSAKGV